MQDINAGAVHYRKKGESIHTQKEVCASMIANRRKQHGQQTQIHLINCSQCTERPTTHVISAGSLLEEGHCSSA